MSIKYKIGDRVVDMLDDEGVVVALDDREDSYSKVKVKFGGFFGKTEWCFESMLDRIITK